MRIVFLRSNPVNPDPRVEKEVSSLLAHGHQITIFCWDRSGLLSGKDEIKLKGGSAQVFRWSKRSTFGGGIKNIFKLFFFQLFLLRSLIRIRGKFDVVHAADFDTVLPALLMKLLFRKKLVYDIFDFYVDSFPVPKILKPVVKYADFFVINTSDAVIITNEAREKQIQGSSPKRLCVIHNTPMVPDLLVGSKKDNIFDVTIVYVGILQPGRLLLEIANVFVKHPTWKLIIAGFGSLEDNIRDFSMRYKNIEFLGVVSYRQGLELSASADALFATYDPGVPNHKYSSPNKLYEAMVLSKPIIVCKGTGIDMVVDQGFTGLSIGYDGEGFEEAVSYLIRNKSAVKMMSLNSRKMYEERYSWAVMEERLIKLYDEI